jgi:hypothetical protein
VVFLRLGASLSRNRWFVIAAKYNSHPTVKKAVDKGPRGLPPADERLPDLG